ncbi:RNA polymerase II degradation factor 1 isoform X3 [Nasonia vitripennis]|uniref:Nuclear protein MDM1 n=2 Tax=Nasonia vitripennis TaxID=7425 RepID=A0A7M7IMM8_NASVI|nr:RNA polymerase II degradation factor 1 isoform X3 [Nasonia vitripennis]
MPANKSNHSTPSKENNNNNNNGKQPINGRKKRSANLKHKKHSRTYLQQYSVAATSAVATEPRSQHRVVSRRGSLVMIGSFWNLCRACPAMPIDKLHSEYRSTYTWHEYTGPNQEHTVVRRAPQAPPRTSLEPPLPRRKKCPELAYRTHEFISSAAQQHANIQAADGGGLVGGGGGGGIDALDSNVVADKVREVTKTLPASQLSKAITRISTEYRLQFAWPRRQQHQLTNGEIIAHSKDEALSNEQQQVPRKSLSMGALKQGSIMAAAPAPVHKKRQHAAIDHRRDGVQASELEPLVRMDGALPEADEQDELDAVELKLTLKKSGNRAVRIAEQPGGPIGGEFRKTQERPFSATEVIELRRELKRLADEYKHRDWGGGMATEDEATLWKRVSNNHALNALSLARSATKEEKEKENTRKVGPAAAVQAAQVAPAGRPSSVQAHARPLHQTLTAEDVKAEDNRAALARLARKDFFIRHHLDRTTGAADGALLPSPTREKLEPVMPRRRDENQQQTDTQPRSKPSPKNSPRSARSQSVGPSVVERRSPKRHPQRPPSVAKDLKEKEKDKEMREKSSERERHPRPSAVSRWKTNRASSSASTGPRSRSESTTRLRRRPYSTASTASSKPFLATNAPPHRPAHHAKPISTLAGSANLAAAAAASQTSTSANAKSAQSLNAQQNARQSISRVQPAASAATKQAQRQPAAYSKTPLRQPQPQPTSQAGQATESAAAAANGVSGVQSPHQQVSQAVESPHPPQPGWIDDEPVVKSPPEPTRVKSPEQMIMRSPEPVNWTVPLDTGKTFTVTQNVREGEPPTRAHSEARSWAGLGPQSAAPDLQKQLKLTEHKQQQQQQQQQQQSGYKSPESESVSLGSFSGTNGHKEQEDSLAERDSPLATIVKDEMSQEAPHCLEEPVFEFESKTKMEGSDAGTASQPAAATAAVPQEQHATDLLEKARNRFDKFWGSGKGSEQ